MKFVLVDTTVWSLAFRKRKLAEKEERLIEHLVNLIRDRRIIMIGAIRQEILCGISDYKRFEILCDKLEAFSDFEIDTNDYVTAARFFNECRAKGIQGSATDFLICSVAHNHNFSILTLDKDFSQYKKIVDIDLIDVEKL